MELYSTSKQRRRDGVVVGGSGLRGMKEQRLFSGRQGVLLESSVLQQNLPLYIRVAHAPNTHLLGTCHCFQCPLA